MGIADYLSLIRLKNHLAYMEIVVPALLFAQNISFDLLVKSLILLYVSFTLLLYGGLYTLNGIADVEEDSRDPAKRLRPIPSGKVSIKSALIFSAVLIATGFFSGFLLFGIKALYYYSLFTVLNLSYSFFAKRVPFLEICYPALTHTLRSLMAFHLFNYEIPYMAVIALFPFHLGLMANLRELEIENKGTKARHVLKYYKPVHFLIIHAFSLITLALIFLADSSRIKVLYILLLAYYMIPVFLVKLVPKRMRHKMVGI